MAETKTRPTEVGVEEYIGNVESAAKREDAVVLDALFRKITGMTPQMWGPSIIGYGQYHYRYETGHEGNMCRAGFSPRKARHSLYLLGCGGKDEAMEALLTRLGKHSRGAGCLYVNKLADVDLAVLEEMIALSWQNSLDRYPD